MATKREKDSNKRIAREFFIRTDLSYQEIAELSGLTANTVEKYAQIYNWAAEKEVLETSQSVVVADLWREVQEISNYVKSIEGGPRFAPKELATARRISLESIKLMDKREDAGLLVSIMIDFLKFASARLDAPAFDNLKKVQTEFLLEKTTKI